MNLTWMMKKIILQRNQQQNEKKKTIHVQKCIFKNQILSQDGK